MAFRIEPFTAAQSAALVAAMDRVIPADDYPSASAAGVGEFISRLMTGDLADRAAAFAAGLDALDVESAAHCGLPFAKCWPDVQDAILGKLESGGEPVARAFVAALVQLVTEGYYTDPSTGGNRDAVSWRMVGFDPRVPQNA